MCFLFRDPETQKKKKSISGQHCCGVGRLSDDHSCCEIGEKAGL